MLLDSFFSENIVLQNQFNKSILWNSWPFTFKYLHIPSIIWCLCVYLRVWCWLGGGYMWGHFRSLQETFGYSAAGKLDPLLSCSIVFSFVVLRGSVVLFVFSRQTGRQGFRRETLRMMLRWVSKKFAINGVFVFVWPGDYHMFLVDFFIANLF